MALDNFDSGIRSVTYTTGPDGKPKEVDPVNWTRDDYFHNLQASEAGVSMQPLKSVASEKPQMVGEDLLEKANKKDLKRRGLD